MPPPRAGGHRSELERRQGRATTLLHVLLGAVTFVGCVAALYLLYLLAQLAASATPA